MNYILDWNVITKPMRLIGEGIQPTTFCYEVRISNFYYLLKYLKTKF